MKTMEIDEKDKKILTCLIENSRMTIKEISFRTKISEPTIVRRLKKLEDDICDPTASIKYDKLGYRYYSVDIKFEIGIQHEKIVNFFQNISKKKGVFSVYEIIGDLDGRITAYFKNKGDLQDFIDHSIRNRKEIKEFKVAEVMKKYISLGKYSDCAPKLLI